jgi:hypothetical protein
MHAKTAKCISALHRQCAKMLQTTNNVRLIVMHGRDDSRLAEQKESHLALLGHVDVFMWVASLLQKMRKCGYIRWCYIMHCRAADFSLASSVYFPASFSASIACLSDFMMETV